MNMIIDPTDNDGLAVEVRENAAQVTMKFLAKHLVLQERPAILRGEYGVNEDFR